MVMIDKANATFVLSPSDLTSSGSCEFAWMRGVDIKLGRSEKADASEGARLARTATLS